MLYKKLIFIAKTNVFSVIIDKLHLPHHKAAVKNLGKTKLQLSSGTYDEVMWLWVSLGHFQPLMFQHLLQVDPVKINR